MPKRWPALGAASAAVLSLILAGCAGPHQIARAATPAEPPVQLAVLGDSLAFGTGAGDTAGGFAFRIYRAIAATRPGSEITNVAIGGSTAADVLRLQTARLRERRFDAVILCVGGNDVVRGIPTATFAANYSRLLTAIRRSAPHAALVVIGVPDVSISPLFADYALAVRRLAHADDRVARESVRAAGADYVDLFTLTQHAHNVTAFLSQDRFHPSDDGHAQIAAEALPVVEAALLQHAAGKRAMAGNQSRE